MSELKEQIEATLGASYSIERELGGGGMSRVFVADETRLGRRVVIKVLFAIVDSVDRVTTSPAMKDVAASGRLLLMALPGRLNESERAYRAEMSYAKAVGNSSPAIVDSLSLALLDAWFRKQPARAVARLDAALTLHPLASLPELWKNADPELQPAVADAKRRLLQLTAGRKSYAALVNSRGHWRLNVFPMARARSVVQRSHRREILRWHQ